MIRALRKTCERTSCFLGDALVWRVPAREYVLVAWGLVVGLIWLLVGWGEGVSWEDAIASLYLVSTLAAVCAIDARYGIIPDTLVLALALGGAVEIFCGGGFDAVWLRGIEAVVAGAAVLSLRNFYRHLRGYDGLGLGDVKFLAASVLWIGLSGVPVLLVAAVLSALVSLIIVRSEGQPLHGNLALSFGPHLAVGLWLAWIVGAFT